MTATFLRSVCLATAALAPIGAQALYDGDLVSVRGFGTLGAVWNSTDEANFKRNVVQPDGPRGDLDWRTDTRLGLQISTPMEATWSATAQVLSRYDENGSFDPDLVWGFLAYKPVETLTVRAGRLGWDVYMLADTREIGYSYMWVRPPVEFFGSLQLNNFDGLDAEVTTPLGRGILQAKVYGGETDLSIALNDTLQVAVDMPSLVGVNLSYHIGGWQFRVGHTELEMDMSLDGSITLPPAAEGAPPFTAPLDNIPAGSTDLGFSTVGALGHHGPWEFQLMYAYIQSTDDQVVPSFDNAYVSAGYRMGKWMPYATYATTATKGENNSEDLPAGGIGDFFQNANLLPLPGQHSLSLGTRYDIRENMALKFQVDRIHARNHMFWTDVESGWDGQATVISATLDFVF